MPPRAQRLRSAEVAAVQKRGRAMRGTYLSAKIVPAEHGTMRMAAVVSKRVAKTAVKRNMLRRALYRAALHALPTSSGRGLRIVLYVNIIPPAPLERAFAEDIKGMFTRGR